MKICKHLQQENFCVEAYEGTSPYNGVECNGHDTDCGHYCEIDIKIKRCPFCGEEGMIAFDNGLYFIVCSDCNSRCRKYRKEEDAIAAWNKRYNSLDCKNAETRNGKCVGYQKSKTNDEPCEQCEKCPKFENYGEYDKE